MTKKKTAAEAQAETEAPTAAETQAAAADGGGSGQATTTDVVEDPGANGMQTNKVPDPAGDEMPKKQEQAIPGRNRDVVRRKVNRGSTRRITKALNAFDEAFGKFIKEIDLQFYQADDKGERDGTWEVVERLREVRQGIVKTINENLHPAPADDGE